MEENSVIAIYDRNDQAEEAIKQLQKSGFDMKKLSIVSKGYETENRVIGYYNAGDRMKHWGKFGAFWGGIWGLLLGAAFLIIPGVGPVLLAGPVVAAIIAALEGAVVVGGLSVIGAGLYSMGIPKDSVIRYESALKANKFLLVVHGGQGEVARVRDVLKTTNASEVTMHSATEARKAEEEPVGV